MLLLRASDDSPGTWQVFKSSKKKNPVAFWAGTAISILKNVMCMLSGKCSAVTAEQVTAAFDLWTPELLVDIMSFMGS